jgi:anti-sigma regulatory factor (Ser/Thr protein kinase)
MPQSPPPLPRPIPDVMSGPHQARWFLPAADSSVATARHRVVAQLRLWGFYVDAESAGDLATVLSEVVTNAVRHGTGLVVTILLTAQDRQVRVEVIDGSEVAPQPRAALDEEEDGRGLMLVSALSNSWGTHPVPGGKSVWFTLSLPAQPRNARRAAFLARLIRDNRPRPASPR